MKNHQVLSCLCCPKCQGSLVKEGRLLICSQCGHSYEWVEKNIIKMLLEDIPGDVRLSLERWDDLYQKDLQSRAYEKEKEEYDKVYLKDVLDQMLEHRLLKRGEVYLEIGCGPMFLGQELSKKGLTTIGIDLSLSSLIIAKRMLEERGVENFLLICGDIRSLPLERETVDVIYGGGVIEHFKDTSSIVSEMYRVLKPGGICFNTVPQLNLGSLTYRQLWGNIPDTPILRQVAEFYHLKLLKGKHLKFGYELSFSKEAIKKVFEKRGFARVTVKKFKCFLPFNLFPYPWLKKLARKISKFEIFNPMLLIVAQK